MKKKLLNINDAVKDTALSIQSSRPNKICLTGGNFGLRLLKELYELNYTPHNEEFFLTDERLNCIKKNQNSISITSYLTKLANFDISRFITFQQTEEPNLSYSELSKRIDSNYFDFTLLSLGEDGHLAGHFVNSILLRDKRFCFTSEAPKEPKCRISFSVEHLMKSKAVTLAIFGDKKKDAMIELINGNGLHSSVLGSDNLTILTDIKI